MKRFILVMVMIVAIIGLSSQAMAASAIVRLGEALYKDLGLSEMGNQSCMTCHHPLAGFADPSNHVDPIDSPNSDGSSGEFFGGRNAPSAAYAGFLPGLDCVDDEGLFCTGGMFWDGRATGRADFTDTAGIEVSVPYPNVGTSLVTGPTLDPLADQAKGPFQNPVEMALVPDQVIDRVVDPNTNYNKLFKRAFGYRVATLAATNAPKVYNDIAIAIAAFERSRELNKFSSKFDRFAKEQAKKGVDVSTIALDDTGVVVDEFGFGRPVRSKVFMPEELEGLALFNMPNDNNGELVAGEGGNCAACHPSGPITDPTDSQGKTLFTDASYDNLGVPVNPKIAELAGAQPIDYGLGAIVPKLTALDPQIYALIDAQEYCKSEYLAYNGSCETVLVDFGTVGLFKVPTLRNVAQTAPYAHNGFFPTLMSIVQFYSDRDVPAFGAPEPEVPDNVNGEELGNLGLGTPEMEKIVLFMETLTDR